MSEYTALMSDPTANLEELLKATGLLDKAERVDDQAFRLRWGSAMLIVGISGPALVVIAPLFKAPPPGNALAFYRRLLELNGTLGGVASFAIQPDGWIVLHGGRDVRDMSAHEFAVLVTTVAREADHYDDLLISEFFAPPSQAEPDGDAYGADDVPAAPDSSAE